MKDFLAKIKTMNYKQFALEHGEKIGLGVIGVVALACLGMTTWSTDFKITPEDMEKQASKVEKELTAKPWPETEKAAFLPLKTADEETAVALSSVDLKKYEWLEPFSRKLYPKQRPAGEIDWLPPVELYARYGTIPMGVFAPPTNPDADEPADKPKKPSKKSGKKGNEADALMDAGGSAAGAGYGMGMNAGGFGGSGEKARGVRFNVVVGVVNVLEQQKRLAKAMALENTYQAAQYLDYIDFKIQRQRAVPGTDTWSGPWKDLSTDSSMEVVLNESSDQDLEIVPPKFTMQTFTSPLPHRLDTDWWDANLVGHRLIPTLTEDEQEQQDALNRQALEIAGTEADDPTKRKGFARGQRDVNRLRDKAMEMDSGKMTDRMKSMGGSGSSGGRSGSRPPGGMGMPGMSGSMPPPGMSGSMPGMSGAMPGMRPGAMGMTSGVGMGMGMGGEGSANLLLFRYFDFDVEPGECYRYRVQLEVVNPNFGESFVDQPSVAEGETRTTPWSVPSTAAAVEKDVNYALAKISTKSNRPDGAELKVVQFDTNSGTLLSDQFKVAYGAFVGAVKKSLHLDIAQQKFEEEEVTFNSKDILLDSAGAPNLSDSVRNDLKLDSKQFNNLKRGGDLDLAVTVNRFGEIVELNAGSRQELEDDLKKVKDERSEYESIRNAEKKIAKEREKEEDDGKPKKGRRRKKGGPNPMRSMSGSGGMYGMPPGAAAPGASPSRSRSKSSSIRND